MTGTTRACSPRRWLALVGTLAVAVSAGASDDGDVWAGYLDYAYVFTSAEPEALKARLAGYGREAGSPLARYTAATLEAATEEVEFDEARVRRRAIAHLLDYLATGEPRSLDRSVDAVREFEGRLSRHENRYWYHYVLAHRALEKGRAHDFVGEVLDLWLTVVVPLETPFDALQILSLSDSPNSGFVAALPYVYENVTRLVLIRSQQIGLDRGLDPLSAVARLLHDGRIGSQPEVIPVAASSRDYVDRIVTRLNGPESDAGSLTFTLALFEASRYHEEARELLAAEGLSAETVKAIRVASGAYETALNRADTGQGQCAVYSRVLRLLGEVYAAKQRLGVDPDVETPFTIEGAIEVYSLLHREGRDDGWKELGYAAHGRQTWLDAMHGLWQEIQEASLNAADYYLALSVEQPHKADENARNAARIHARYLSFFRDFAASEGKEAVPDSAYFAAYEAAKGYADAYLHYSSRTPSRQEMELATRSTVNALKLYPFDRQLFPALTAALERQGRGNGYLSLARPVAESVARSRSVDRWIESAEPGADEIEALRRALSDGLVLMYLGFADATGVEELEATVVDLEAERALADARLAELRRRRDEAGRAVPAALDVAASGENGSGENGHASNGNGAHEFDPVALEREIAEASALVDRLAKQLEARERALPLYRATLGTDGLTSALRSQRDHPVHTLLRRMYHEKRS